MSVMKKNAGINSSKKNQTIKILCFYAFFMIFLVSCGKKSSAPDFARSFKNLREEAQTLDQKITWTEELERGRLEAVIKEKKGISDKVALSPLAVSAALSQDDIEVYPSLTGFTSLDTSLIDDFLWRFLDDFSHSFMKGDGLERYFLSESKISLTLFYIDFDKALREEFGIDSREGIIFTEFIAGSPYIENDFTKVPLMFYGKNYKMILNLFCTQETKNSWKAEQIQLVSLEENHEQS